MSLHGDGLVRQLVNLDINLFVLMSGNKDSVIRRSIGVQYVQIETFHH